ncbi:bifunctional 5,10-methylenetetrahydrofolate dehydrogenase/5,10-methenyltetrahydrofolate cyclohydrolase [Nocardiopsis alba]|uniref:bifunctional 5,10-methylenetetrahydrofolate dehydrogenase/5,10-methenyltetrahydrofolate cyclohydrolase n=1 Tax=Nocardiopsis alba TaxID=53437 RepID=UPI0033C35738
MSAVSLSGKDFAVEIRSEVQARVGRLLEFGVEPRLSVVVATDDGGSAWYVRSIARAAEKVGIACDIVDLGADATTDALKAQISELGRDPSVHGIILQTPLPPGVQTSELVGLIDVYKDVDGANPTTLGLLMAGVPTFPPATAEAVVALLEHHEVPLEGREVAVVGRSTVVGKPLAHLLLDRNATVTVCHSRTKNLAKVTSRADVVVAAVGRAELLGAEHVRPGAVVVDVGTNPTEDGGLVGDVNAGEVGAVAGALTPVPGGVGPVTTALLLRHTVHSAEK